MTGGSKTADLGWSKYSILVRILWVWLPVITIGWYHHQVCTCRVSFNLETVTIILLFNQLAPKIYTRSLMNLNFTRCCPCSWKKWGERGSLHSLTYCFHFMAQLRQHSKTGEGRSLGNFPQIYRVFFGASWTRSAMKPMRPRWLKER